jgi:thioredoxin-like negative regulator of GroEL
MSEHNASDRIQTVTSKTFNSLIAEGAGPIAVEFMSYGCGHCREIEPVLQKVAEMVKSKEKIFRVNTAVDQELANQYEISGTPTIVLFLDGKEVGRVEGPSPKISSVLAAVSLPYETHNELHT